MYSGTEKELPDRFNVCVDAKVEDVGDANSPTTKIKFVTEVTRRDGVFSSCKSCAKETAKGGYASVEFPNLIVCEECATNFLFTLKPRRGGIVMGKYYALTEIRKKVKGI